MSASGDWAGVVRFTRQQRIEPVYNFAVEGNHNYFVSNLGWLVHNQYIKPYDVGLADDLLSRSKVGDNLDIHHAVQKHPASQIIPNYFPGAGPSIALPHAEHAAISNLSGTYGGTARDLLARDIRNLRNLTNVPNSALRDLINLNKSMYPGVFGK